MLFLVVGADHVDAGKTTFSTGLLERTGALGYKPRAGNDFWFDHDDCLSALSDGRLYGKDARKLAAADRADRPPEALNPVHRLWQPAPGESAGILGREDREFIVDRISRPDRDDPLYVHNATAEIPDPVADAVPLEESKPIDSVERLNELVRHEYVPAFEALTTEIKRADLAVVESYGDIALPLHSLEARSISVVAVVEPSRVRLYHGTRYHRAWAVTRSSPHEGSLEKRVPDVIDSLDPVATLALPPLTDAERSDPEAVAKTYESAYDAVLEIAAKQD